MELSNGQRTLLKYASSPHIRIFILFYHVVLFRTKLFIRLIYLLNNYLEILDFYNKAMILHFYIKVL